MSKRIIQSLLLILLLMSKTFLGPVYSVQIEKPPKDSQQPINTLTSLTSQPLVFTENRGQWDGRALFRANAGGAIVWFTSESVYYQFVRRASTHMSNLTPNRVEAADPIRSHSDRIGHESIIMEQLVIKATFVGAKPNLRVIGEEKTVYTCNYFIGSNPTNWYTDVPNYRAVVFENLYEGIDLKYYSNGKQMEYDFVFSPGADVTQITVEYEGVKSLSVNEAGALVIETDWGIVSERAPLVYQVKDGRKKVIPSAYRLESGRTFGYDIGGDYDPSLPLVVDPILLYSTCLGGMGEDYGWAVEVDASGSAYITGQTMSIDFPTQDPFQSTFQGLEDAFVTKLTPAGDDLVYSTYLGGDGDDRGQGIAVNGSGNAFITGSTASTNFPTENPFKDAPIICDGDAFVTKLSPRGNSLVFSTYLGGDDVDWGYGIAVDGNDHAYVAGFTQSSDFPTLNPYQTFQGARDGYVTKFTVAGDSLVYSTCLGGDTLDGCWAVAVDAGGHAYATGVTQSANFPTENPYQTYQGDRDVFVTKLSTTGNSLQYSTYLGGSGYDEGKAITVDGSGFAYVTGRVASYDFPTENPYQTNDDYDDVFVTKLNATGNGLVYSTYLGGNRYETGFGIVVNDSGHACVTGYTWSTDFPTLNPYQIHQDTLDVFVTKFNSTGNGLLYSTYLGGNGVDKGHGVTMDDFGNIYVTGYTASSDFPTLNPYQSFQNVVDAFVTKIPRGYGTSIDHPQKPIVPYLYALYQNIPNPFNPLTVIRYDVPAGGGKVSISIYDVQGKLVRTLVDGPKSAGHKTVTWYGRNNQGERVTSGVYFCRMTAPGFEKTRKMILLK